MTLLVPALFSAGTLALVLWRFKETLAQPNPQALQVKTLVRTWTVILRNPTFLAYSSLSVASYGGLFTFLATSPFVFIQVLGLSKTQFGMVLFLMCFAYLLGTFLCRRLLQRYGVQNAAALAAVLSLSAGALMAALAWYGIQNVWSLCLPFALYMLGHGVHQPCGLSGAVGPFPKAAGTAAALNGFLMMLVAFLIGTWLGTHMDGSARPLIYGVAAWSVVLALTAWTVVRRYGRSNPVAPACVS